MRILMIIPFYYPIVAGAELFAQEVAETLVKNGHEVHVLTRGATFPDKTVLPIANSIHGVTVHRIMSKWCDGSMPSTQSPLAAIVSIAALAFHLRRLLRQLKPDIIHTHVFPAGVAGVLGTIGNKTPSVYAEQQAGFKDYHPFLDNPIGLGFQRMVNRRVNVVQATSQAGATFATAHGARHAIVIPNGVRLPPPTPRHPWTPDQMLQISTVSRLEYKNGIDLLLNTIRGLKDRIPNLCLSVQILGDGSKREALEKLAASLGLSKDVHFQGYAPHDTIWNTLAKTHIFVRPSRQEGFGIAFLESMASGAITVGTNVGGIPDIITQGETGFLAKPNDAESLLDVLLQIIQSPQSWEQIQIRALETVKTRFCWEQITRDLEVLYQTLKDT